MDLLRDRFKYRIHIQLRRKGQPALEDKQAEFKSEAFNSDEELCLAVAAELIEQLIADREFQEGQDDNTD